MLLAVSSGVPLSNGRALVAEGAAVRVVDMKTERYDGPPRDVGPEGSKCEALSSEEEGVAVCYGQSSVALVSHVLGSHPRTERQFQGTPVVSYAAGSLLVGGRCSGAQEAGIVCERRAGAWVEHDMRKAVGREPGCFLGAQGRWRCGRDPRPAVGLRCGPRPSAARRGLRGRGCLYTGCGAPDVSISRDVPPSIHLATHRDRMGRYAGRHPSGLYRYELGRRRRARSRQPGSASFGACFRLLRSSARTRSRPAAAGSRPNGATWVEVERPPYDPPRDFPPRGYFGEPGFGCSPLGCPREPAGGWRLAANRLARGTAQSQTSCGRRRSEQQRTQRRSQSSHPARRFQSLNAQAEAEARPRVPIGRRSSRRRGPAPGFELFRARLIRGRVRGDAWWSTLAGASGRPYVRERRLSRPCGGQSAPAGAPTAGRRSLRRTCSRRWFDSR